MIKEKIWINGKCITYILMRKKVKNINLRIKPDLTIVISASPRISKKRIEDFLISKGDWIEEKLGHVDSLERIRFMEFSCIGGEEIRLFGRNLKLILLPSNSNKVEMDQNNLYLYCKDINNLDQVKKYWNQWYQLFIKESLYDIVKEVHSIFYQYHNNMPKIKLRYMKTRWGTCNKRTDTITLNKFLIEVPIECIEYVIIHEFTHFIHPNHSKEFYETLKSFLPDHKSREKMLDRYIIIK
ncbi:hypothetical protein EDD66_104326 [Mobilisporobacter senegalensis]|uniref:YgjP-like metallopeptidase domain-containing protein n=1 Tax=Mobilisporobacter senegalensis TaxID=1329262 RepID=A0A3N1XV03_9FIRM|nr:SprT family zinc-dependent metalloprotease [Mobilisporobacter senegalensis]ROR28737.1 hypothetical protein EDD66_104326 [Mobilisporobacter senegalensis]